MQGLLQILIFHIFSQEFTSISMMAVFKEKAFAIHTTNSAVTVAGAEYGKVFTFFKILQSLST